MRNKLPNFNEMQEGMYFFFCLDKNILTKVTYQKYMYKNLKRKLENVNKTKPVEPAIRTA